MEQRRLDELMQNVYNRHPTTVAKLRAALASLQDTDELFKLAVTGNVGIVRDDKQIGYIDLMDGTVELFRDHIVEEQDDENDERGDDPPVA